MGLVVDMVLQIERARDRAAACGPGRIVPEVRIEHREVDGVEPEAIDALVEPELGGGHQRVLDHAVMDVQLRLGREEIVHIVLLAAGVPGPGGAAEDGLPVVRRGAVGLRILPHIPVRIRIVAGLPALREPVMCVGRMGVDLIDDDLEAEPVGLCQQGVKVRQRAEDRVDIAIVRHVIAEIAHRGFEEGRDPDGVHPEPGDMAELLGDPRQVADPVPVGVQIGARVDLVDDGAAPPGLGSFGRGRVFQRSRS